MQKVTKNSEAGAKYGYGGAPIHMDYAHMIHVEKRPDGESRAAAQDYNIGFGLDGRTFKYEYKVQLTDGQWEMASVCIGSESIDNRNSAYMVVQRARGYADKDGNFYDGAIQMIDDRYQIYNGQLTLRSTGSRDKNDHFKQKDAAASAQAPAWYEKDRLESHNSASEEVVPYIGAVSSQFSRTVNDLTAAEVNAMPDAGYEQVVQETKETKNIPEEKKPARLAYLEEGFQFTKPEMEFAKDVTEGKYTNLEDLFNAYREFSIKEQKAKLTPV